MELRAVLGSSRIVTFTTAVLVVAGLVGPASAASNGLIWGVNGHPIVSYSGIPLTTQLEYVRELGMTSYRVDISSTERLLDLQNLVREAQPRGITVLPVITPGFDMDKESAEALEKKSYGLAFALVSSFRGELPVWELGNELENYAIIRPCDMQDDGKQYNCSYGSAGGVSATEYFGPRWAKVSAVLKGLTSGARAADPSVRRAFGTAGWGHVGAFERMKADGIEWEISVWHMYGEDPEWGFKKIAEYERPIWVTEFNNRYGSHRGADQQAEGLKKWMARLRELHGRYQVEAAHVYELMDEPYWGDDYEAFMGLDGMKKDPHGGWSTGERKPAFSAVQQVIAASKPKAAWRRCEPTAVAAGDVKAIVTYAYCLVLGRDPDGAGMQSYAARLGNDLTRSELVVDLMNSEEFVKRHGVTGMSPDAYVRLLHQILAGKDPDEATLERIVARMKAAGVRTAQKELIESPAVQEGHPSLYGKAMFAAAPETQRPPSPLPEVRRRCDLGDLELPIQYERGQVVYSFCLVLGRWPDPVGLISWSRNRRDGISLEQLLLGLIQSDEFARTYQTHTLDDRQFVVLIYRLLLASDPDAATLERYGEQLTSGGMSRSQFCEAVFASSEFRHKQDPLFSAKMLDRKPPEAAQ